MRNHIQPSEYDVPVLPPATPTIMTPAEPKPIVISPNSKLAMSLPTQQDRSDTAPHAARTTPIVVPATEVSTPLNGIPRVPPSGPTLPPAPTLPAVTISAVAPALALVEPELGDVVAAVVEQEESRFVTDGSHHPMAHLMPPRTKPSEAQQRANQLRAAKKKKSRRVKVIAVIATVAFGAFAGPPLASWVVDAVNESGNTQDTTDDAPPADPATDGGG